jgi:translation initiation factor IF-2
LSEVDVLVEDWGGEVMCVPVSAKTQDGIEDLLESITLVAEMQEFKANPTRPAQGVVLEGRMDQRRGATATVLIQNGVLRQGDSFVAGQMSGNVRAMFDYRDQRIQVATPSTPVRILGIDGVPAAGDRFEVVADDKTARRIAEEREERPGTPRGEEVEITLETLFAQFQEGEAKELNVILKADVQGSIEPIVSSITDLSTDEIKVNLIHQGTGTISESDIMLAITSRAVVVGFNVHPDTAARRLAESEGVDIRHYRLIYQIIDDIQLALNGMLDPVYQDVLTGQAEVRAVFRVRGAGQVAGCYVQAGTIDRNSRVLVRRNGEELYDGFISSLKRFQEDVAQVRTGFECGIGVEGFADFREGDEVISYQRERVPVA